MTVPPSLQRKITFWDIFVLVVAFHILSGAIDWSARLIGIWLAPWLH